MVCLLFLSGSASLCLLVFTSCNLQNRVCEGVECGGVMKVLNEGMSCENASRIGCNIKITTLFFP